MLAWIFYQASREEQNRRHAKEALEDKQWKRRTQPETFDKTRAWSEGDSHKDYFR